MRPTNQFHEELREQEIPWHEHRYENVGKYGDVGKYEDVGEYRSGDVGEYEDVGLYEEIDTCKTWGRS